MLSIHLKDDFVGDDWPPLQWNVGDPQSLSDRKIREIEFIQVSGDELNHIVHKLRIKAPRTTLSTIVKYYGEQAQYIVGNL